MNQFTGKCLLVLAVLGVMASPAWATMENLKAYKQAYPGKDAKAYTCTICHQGAPVPTGKLTAYGESLIKLKADASSAKQLTVEDFRAAESGDADKDGTSNGDELKAGTNPSDPKSVPASAAKP